VPSGRRSKLLTSRRQLKQQPATEGARLRIVARAGHPLDKTHRVRNFKETWLVTQQLLRGLCAGDERARETLISDVTAAACRIITVACIRRRFWLFGPEGGVDTFSQYEHGTCRNVTRKESFGGDNLSIGARDRDDTIYMTSSASLRERLWPALHYEYGLAPSGIRSLRGLHLRCDFGQLDQRSCVVLVFPRTPTTQHATMPYGGILRVSLAFARFNIDCALGGHG
jgi:hypothetical protein